MAFKMNGWSAFTKPDTPTTNDEGSDAWRAKFLKQHGVTNDEVNAEIEEIGGGEEDDVDFNDWKALVKKISKMKSSELEKKKTTATGLPQEEYQPQWENADEVD